MGLLFSSASRSLRPTKSGISVFVIRGIKKGTFNSNIRYNTTNLKKLCWFAYFQHEAIYVLNGRNIGNCRIHYAIGKEQKIKLSTSHIKLHFLSSAVVNFWKEPAKVTIKDSSGTETFHWHSQGYFFFIWLKNEFDYKDFKMFLLFTYPGQKLCSSSVLIVLLPSRVNANDMKMSTQPGWLEDFIN